MAIDVLILNTAVLDLRHPDFAFVDQQVGPGGLAKCPTSKMPEYSQAEIKEKIEQGGASAGGPGNTAPLLARAGLDVAVGAYLGQGEYDGLDIQGRTFYDTLENAGVDMSACETHPSLPTGTTFIHETPGDERGGIAYFPNANDDFDFERFKSHVRRLQPRVVYYMYSGLSERGDANGGRDLAAFMRWCRKRGAVTIADSHTLTSNPQELIRKGASVDAYRLLEPLLPELDVFFTSSDEAKMIRNTLDQPQNWTAQSAGDDLEKFLQWLVGRFADGENPRARLFGVTQSNGAVAVYLKPDGTLDGPRMIQSRYTDTQVVDFVGAGDSFRAGVIAHIARTAEAFKDGAVNLDHAVQMGNLMATRYLQAPLDDRYCHISTYNEMLEMVANEK